MGSCAAPSAKGDDKFITTDYLQQCLPDCPCRLITQKTVNPKFLKFKPVQYKRWLFFLSSVKR
ncbi:hypothetical protein ES858_16585 [Salmonella enterica]|nr:hypothetical protein [Salmonella enterica]